MTIEEAKTFLDNLKVCIEEHPIVADWLVEIADRKTEPKPICESCSKNPCKKKEMISAIGHWVSECTEFDRKNEPQTDCSWQKGE